ncbi:uncharacterized protein LOC110866749 [Helianthus annuus]|uniref:uncharacterized protein LOC110866749 n=1 Tax=Helianthus annuus TaxID=4232 RepID=UPI000B8FDBD2|nr:uncharacterized protein LOC110866749 [Helianthus annuus]
MNGVSSIRKGMWVKKLKKDLKADVIGIQETHRAGLSKVELRRFWDNTCLKVASVDSAGRSGGLAMLWNPDLFRDESILKNNRFLMVSGRIVGVEEKMNLVNIHAPNDARLRRSFWTELLNLLSHVEGMKVLFGDFNDVRDEEERVNSTFDRSASEAFNDFISTAGLFEFSVTGGKFTFISGHANVKLSKLDRF